MNHRIKVRKGTCPECGAKDAWVVYLRDGRVWDCYFTFSIAMASATALP